MYNIGTVSTTANSPKITGTGTRWKDNSTLVSVGQLVLIENGSTLIINCIDSIESNTALTLGFPVSAKLTNVKYRILTTMIDSISDGVNKATAQVIASEIFTDIFTELMTGTGIIEFELPNGQKVKLRTENEKDKQLDGKFDKTGGELNGGLKAFGAIQTSQGEVTAHVLNGAAAQLNGQGDIARLRSRSKDGKWYDHVIPESAGTLLQVNDYGIGNPTPLIGALNISLSSIVRAGSFIQQYSVEATLEKEYPYNGLAGTLINYPSAGAKTLQEYRVYNRPQLIYYRSVNTNGSSEGEPWILQYNTGNTTKDSNGNLKAASPVVKLFADDIELNDESEGVEMEHLGIGHYLIKGVVGFNADGAWGINNGFVIPQDHNGKNMVLIDYEVRPDGDIEVFVFHQQNADMPERFQNKRIKHFDEEGVPVYFENYEPCDVPESRWIDMRVEMPPNSLYNQKQAEAERLAKIEAERLAQEEAKRAAQEAERAEQEAAEQVEQQ
ncbi:pyocin knob domain-containing protein [Providencia sp. PROV197]|uniref:pyocin knob domain-containing protein n=1 Tax=Providencia sp. PROV197 TaxID=2949898 RepID=UPI00234A974B|nr:pyocin knob domain-containing protein [Providencia sp. PROV197]